MANITRSNIGPIAGAALSFGGRDARSGALWAALSFGGRDVRDGALFTFGMVMYCSHLSREV